jgi:hypothetical protein
MQQLILTSSHATSSLKSLPMMVGYFTVKIISLFVGVLSGTDVSRITKHHSVLRPLEFF